MVHLHSIDIGDLARILCYAIGPHANNISEWKPRLRFLHICTLWSSITKPLVFCDSFIELSVVLYKRFGILSKAVQKTICISNLDIIIGRGSQTNVRSLSVDAPSTISYLDLFTHIFHALKPKQNEWLYVRRFTVNMLSDWHNFDPRDNSEIESSIIDNFVKDIYKCLPNIKILSVIEPDINQGKISNPLFYFYIQQLHYARVFSPIYFNFNVICPNLTEISIQLNKYQDNFDFPCLFAAPLYSLQLFNVPPYFSWRVFCDADGPNIIFNNLKKLDIRFEYNTSIYSTRYTNVDYSKRKHSYYKLHFPKLEHLVIMNCPPESELLECCSYFKKLKTIELGDCDHFITFATVLGLHTANTIKLYIDQFYMDDGKRFYDAANHLFGKLNDVSNVHLWMRLKLNLSNLQNISWINLTKIMIHNSIDFDLYINLLNMLPKLTVVATLELQFITANKADNKSSNDIISQNKPQLLRHYVDTVIKVIAPWIKSRKAAKNIQQFLDYLVVNRSPINNPKLETIAIYFSYEQYNKYNVAVIVSYIVVAFPSLKIVYIDPRLNIMTLLVEKLKERISNLDTLKLRYVNKEYLNVEAQKDNVLFY